MYNFASFLAQTVSTEQTDCNKYTYNLNHTQLQKICIRFLKGIIEEKPHENASVIEPLYLFYHTPLA